MLCRPVLHTQLQPHSLATHILQRQQQRVMTIAALLFAERLHLEDLQHSSLQPWDGSVAYARDKRRQVAMAEHLTTTMAGQGVCMSTSLPAAAS
jgi:hypothetical protein